MMLGIVAGGAVEGGGPTPGTDPLYSFVSLLLHCDGVAGSTSFPDSGPHGLLAGVAGPVSVDTTEYVFGGASAHFEGSPARILYPANVVFGFGLNDLTMEGRVWLDADAPSGGAVIFDCRTSGGADIAPVLGVTNSGGGNYFFCYTGVGPSIAWAGGLVAVGGWHAFRLQLAGGAFGFHLDGAVQTFTSGTPTSAVADFGVAKQLLIGIAVDGTSQPLPGRLDELRITQAQRSPLGSNYTLDTVAFPDS